MAYASVEDVQERMLRSMSEDEQAVCTDTACFNLLTGATPEA